MSLTDSERVNELSRFLGFRGDERPRDVESFPLHEPNEWAISLRTLLASSPSGTAALVGQRVIDAIDCLRADEGHWSRGLLGGFDPEVLAQALSLVDKRHPSDRSSPFEVANGRSVSRMLLYPRQCRAVLLKMCLEDGHSHLALAAAGHGRALLTAVRTVFAMTPLDRLREVASSMDAARITRGEQVSGALYEVVALPDWRLARFEPKTLDVLNAVADVPHAQMPEMIRVLEVAQARIEREKSRVITADDLQAFIVAVRHRFQMRQAAPSSMVIAAP